MNWNEDEDGKNFEFIKISLNKNDDTNIILIIRNYNSTAV